MLLWPTRLEVNYPYLFLSGLGLRRVRLPTGWEWLDNFFSSEVNLTGVMLNLWRLTPRR
jgi:hypothetical protein